MERYFRRIGLETHSLYTNEGHSFGAWRNAVVSALTRLLPSMGNSSR